MYKFVVGLMFSLICCASADVNIASKKPTKMSSVYVPPINQNSKFLCCYSEYAVDGDKSVWTGNNLVCAHSKKDNQHPWWAVDLQNVYDVKVIDIYGRTDDYPEQLSNFDVAVVMPACSCNIWNRLYDGDQFQCHFQATPSQHITITCPNDTKGRFVRIKRRDTEVLVICEVDVYGNQVNSLDNAGRVRTAYACGYIGYGYVGPVIGTSVANSDIHCTAICLTNTACTAAEYDKNTQVCTLKGKCMDGAESYLFQDNNKLVFFIQ